MLHLHLGWYYFFQEVPKYSTKKEVQKLLKEERKVREDRAAFNVASVNENADHICWFCHVDVSNLENNKCVQGVESVGTLPCSHCRY